jgi:hypothetical protein
VLIVSSPWEVGASKRKVQDMESLDKEDVYEKVEVDVTLPP